METKSECIRCKAGTQGIQRTSFGQRKISGPVVLMDNMGKGLLKDLTEFFGIEDAKFIYVVAASG